MSSRDLDTPPPEGDPAPRRWSTGHTVAAAVVAVGVFASGGPGQFGGPPPQPPGQLTQGDGGVHT